MSQVEELNPHLKWNWRKKKKFLRNRSLAVERSGYFEDCRNHPCRVTNIQSYRPSNPWTFFKSDVDGESLFNGEGYSCSMWHCAPMALTKAEALERAAFYKKYGMLSYLKKYIYGPMTDEQEAALVAHYTEWGWEI